MAHHCSAKKSLRTSTVRRLKNRFLKKSSKTFTKKLYLIREKKLAVEEFKRVSGMLDQLARKRIYHPNKSARLKSQLALFINGLSASSV